MRLFEKKTLFATFSNLNNLYNATVEVNETVVYCRSLLGLQSHALNFLDLIENNRKCFKNITTSCGLHGYGQENGIFLAINEKCKGRTL